MGRSVLPPRRKPDLKASASSSVGESHPHALTDTDVNLSVHPAPIDQPQLHGLALPNGSSYRWLTTR